MQSWKESLHRAADTAAKLAVDLATPQWRVVCSDGHQSQDSNPIRRAQSLVDIEALILVSTTFKESHPPFGRLLSWWEGVGDDLISRQRLQTHAARFPKRTAPLWIRAETDGELSLNSLDLKKPPLLQLRLRAGFGLNARADLLTCLLGWGGKTASLRDLITATCLAKSSVSKALAAMVSADVVSRTGPRPAKFALSMDPWKEVLGPQAFNHTDSMKFARYLPQRVKYAASPRWRPWMHLFRFLANVSVECSRARKNARARGQLAHRLHTEVELLRRGSWTTGLPLNLPSHATGGQIIDAMPEIVGDLREWYLEHV